MAALAALLSRAGCVAAEDEAIELMDAAGGDGALLSSLADRRLSGEPLAWITGRVDFDGVAIGVHPGVYVPRWQSLSLVRRAAARLPVGGTAIDVCTGSGAIAAALQARCPTAHIVASDSDPRAVACARSNGVRTYQGDLFAPVPRATCGATDVVVAVVPYVPTPEMRLLPHDTLAYETASHYDGGPDGTDLLRRVATEAPSYLRPGGALLLELGGLQADALTTVLDRLGYRDMETWSDQDGDLRGIQAILP